MKKKSDKNELNEKDLKGLAQVLRNQNISLRKLVDEIDQAENRNSRIRKDNSKTHNV